MLPRSQRLSVEQFNVVMLKGRVTHSSFFLLRSLKVDEIGTARKTHIAAVVPQKLVKKATGRNKLRRVMYEAIQPLYNSVSPGLNVILFAKSPAIDADFKILSKEVRDIFVKAGILK